MKPPVCYHLSPLPTLLAFALTPFLCRFLLHGGNDHFILLFYFIFMSFPQIVIVKIHIMYNFLS